jgi:hypothetical protein
VSQSFLGEIFVYSLGLAHLCYIENIPVELVRVSFVSIRNKEKEKVKSQKKIKEKIKIKRQKCAAYYLVGEC